MSWNWAISTLKEKNNFFCFADYLETLLLMITGFSYINNALC